MIIVSQNKSVIVNFNNAINIRIRKNYEETKFEIFVENDNVLTDIGCYGTEERAKEVLQEIIKTYKETNYEYENCWCLRNVIYDMPEK